MPVGSQGLRGFVQIDADLFITHSCPSGNYHSVLDRARGQKAFGLGRDYTPVCPASQ